MSAPRHIFLVDDHPFVRLGQRTACRRQATRTPGSPYLSAPTQ